MSQTEKACPKAVCRPLQGDLETLLTREWLLTNGRGGFAMGTVIGCATRRYHGMMVMSRRPPLERFMLLAGTLDRVRLGDEIVDLSSAEFDEVVHPIGYSLLKDFDYNLARPVPWVQWTYDHPRFELRRRLSMFTGTDVVRLRYDVVSRGGDPFELEVSPMLAMRDFHGLRRRGLAEPWDLHTDGKWLWVQDRADPEVTLAMVPQAGPGLARPRFSVLMEWWNNFQYRADVARGEPGVEDLMCAGVFRAEGTRSVSMELVGVGFATSPVDAQLSGEQAVAVAAIPPQRERKVDVIQRQLLDAADQFVVTRQSHRPGNNVTVIAGYPWFGDWGRDSFIALEGLLLISERFGEARKVLATFAAAERHGLIPNRFDDYSENCAYNSVDASLWFVHAADRYTELSGDESIWAKVLAGPCGNIVRGFVNGTEYGIRVDEHGLVTCGAADTQITWMDALCDGVAFTPRHGRPVEVNVLWYRALRILERRLSGLDATTVSLCTALAEKVRGVFAETFWNESEGCLYDCVRDDEADPAIRPNQVFAVGLPEELLSAERQRAVLNKVTDHLLTPLGLRTLSPGDPMYHRRMVGTRFERDRAYHNGTVWSWLIGPYADAYLHVHGETKVSAKHVQGLIAPLLMHMSEAGLGSISEVFDGDPPHAARGCIAQAWSVAELLRIRHRVDGADPGDAVSNGSLRADGG